MPLRGLQQEQMHFVVHQRWYPCSFPTPLGETERQLQQLKGPSMLVDHQTCRQGDPRRPYEDPRHTVRIVQHPISTQTQEELRQQVEI